MNSKNIPKQGKNKLAIRLNCVYDGTKKTTNNPNIPSLLYISMKSTVRDLVKELEKLTGYTSDQLKLFYDGDQIHSSRLSLFSLLLASDMLNDSEVDNVLIFAYQIMDEIDETQPFIALHGLPFLTDSFQKALTACRIGFSQGLRPELTLDGSGGSYILFDKYKKKRLFFKPSDEEPYNINNPRSFQGPGNCVGFKQGVRSGEGYKREIAAFMIDRTGFFNVPPTLQARIYHPSFSYITGPQIPKVGSLQLFIPSMDIVGNWGPSVFTIQQVQKVCILDIYLLNTDRNDGNILLLEKNGGFVFIPVDHGYCLPDRPEINEYSWCWLEWPQVKKPWSKECIDYINNIDIENDSYMLYNTLGIRKICLIYMRISGLILKTSLQYNLSPYHIACIFVRKGLGDEEKSRLDLILEQTVAITHDLYSQIKKRNRDLELVSSAELRKEHDLFISERNTIKKSKTVLNLDKLHNNIYVADFQQTESKKLLLEDIAVNQELRHLFFDNLKGFLNTLLFNIAKKEGTI